MNTPVELLYAKLPSPPASVADTAFLASVESTKLPYNVGIVGVPVKFAYAK